jgi:hypothetical protein
MRFPNISGKTLWGAGGVLALGALIAGVAAILRHTPLDPPPDPAGLSPADTARFLASDQFHKYSMREKRSYLERLREERRKRMAEGRAEGPPEGAFEELSEEERENLRRNVRRVFMEMMQDAVNDYFALPEAERTAYLDERIDEFRSRGGPRGGPGGGPPRDESARGDGAARRGPTPERVSRMMRMTDPETRAKMIEFRRALRQRMEERGMSPPGRR